MTWQLQQHVWVDGFTPTRTVELDGASTEGGEAYTGPGVVGYVSETNPNRVVVVTAQCHMLMMPDARPYLSPYDPYAARDSEAPPTDRASGC